MVASMAAAPPLPLRFQLGARTPFSVRRRLKRVPMSLAETLAGGDPRLPDLDKGDDGYFVTSVPVTAVDRLVLRHSRLKPFTYQEYARRYADLSLGFEAYMQGFSSKSRSTLRRKLRKFAELDGGSLDVRGYHRPDGIREFHELARAISQRTYQEKLLDAGLPEGAKFEENMTQLASVGQVRAWILFLGGKPVSYLYTPADGDTLVYAYLGYDPAFAQHSPGTVLQLEAMREVMEEGRFRLFDFTEGDGQHKRQFATGSVDCVDLLLLRPSLSNRLTLAALGSFYGAVSLGKALLGGSGSRQLAAKVKG
jgi:CelD/BcsL family acetyltransferase involved in cellulose biosynthesis